MTKSRIASFVMALTISLTVSLSMGVAGGATGNSQFLPSQSIRVYSEEPNWDKIIPIVIQIESSGNPYAVSKDGCIGLMQISPLVLAEFNELSCSGECMPGWDINQMFESWYNQFVGTWYLKRIWFHYLPHYKLEQNIENLLIAYHDGIGNLVKYKQGKRKLGKEMKNYLIKYQKLCNE
jgi:hypothetical protein